MEPTNNELKKESLELRKEDLDYKKAALKERAKKRTWRNATTNASGPLTVIGALAIAVVIAIVIFYIGKYIFEYVRNRPTSPSAPVTLSTNILQTIESPQVSSTTPSVSSIKVVTDKPFTFSWLASKNLPKGAYSLSYPCIEGVTLSALTGETTRQTITCNTDFKFISPSGELRLIAASTKLAMVDLPVTLRFTKDGETEPMVSGVTTIKIVNESLNTNSTKKTTSVTPAYVNNTTSSYYPVSPQTTAQNYTYPYNQNMYSPYNYSGNYSGTYGQTYNTNSTNPYFYNTYNSYPYNNTTPYNPYLSLVNPNASTQCGSYNANNQLIVCNQYGQPINNYINTYNTYPYGNSYNQYNGYQNYNNNNCAAYNQYGNCIPYNQNNNYNPYNPSTPGYNYSVARPDLRVVISDVGYLDNLNNFVSNTQPMQYTRIAVRFRIENVGTVNSGPFRFTAYMPTQTVQTYNSVEQIGLVPSGRIEYTLAFDRALPGTQTFRVVVDPSNLVYNEINRGNNETSIQLFIR